MRSRPDAGIAIDRGRVEILIFDDMAHEPTELFWGKL
jgi:hypothetical protein